jgi:hypothetical protein
LKASTMGLYDRPTRRKRLNETDPSWDRHDSCDPQIAERLFVQLLADPPAPASDEAEAPEPNRELLNALRNAWNALGRQEQFVLIQRLLMEDTYAAIAAMAWPRLRDASRARKIEQRALAKLRNRLKYYKG